MSPEYVLPMSSEDSVTYVPGWFVCLPLVAQPDLHVAGPASTMVKRIRRRPGRSKPFAP